MPMLPQRPCGVRGCPLPASVRGRCVRHATQQPRQPDTRPTATQRGYGYVWRKIRDAYLRQHPECEQCGAKATDVDHRIPRRKGGSDEDTNLQSLCHKHHSRKTSTQDGGRWG